MSRACGRTSVSADLTTHVEGRRLDDDVSALLRFEGGARGVLKASQVAAGEENGLRLRIHGERGGLEWAQMEPNTLTLRWLDRPTEIVRAGGPGLDARPPRCCGRRRVIPRGISRRSPTSTAHSPRRSAAMATTVGIRA